MRRSLTGQNSRGITGGDRATIVDLSSHGNQLLVWDRGTSPGRKHFVRLGDTERGESTLLGEGKPLALSPDGRWALTARSSPNPELVLLPVKPGVERRLPNPGVVVFYEGLWLNNNTVVFVGEAQDQRLRSYVQSVDGSPARPIARPEVRVALASPDGTELAAYGKKGVYYRLSITGEERPPFQGLKQDDELLRWGLDGGLYVRGGAEGQVDLFRVDVDTGARTRVLSYWKGLGDLYWFEGPR